MKKAAFWGVLVAAATACSDAGADPARLAAPADLGLTASHDAWRANLKQERQALLQADHDLSAATEANGFVNGLVGGMDADARFLTTGQNVLRGSATIRAFLAGSGFSTSRMRWEPIRADVSADGTLGYTLGSGVYTRGNGTTATTRYIAAWKKQGDGSWKVGAYMLLLTNPAPLPTPATGFGTRQDNGVRGAHSGDPAATLAAAMQADRDFAALSVAQGPRAAFVAFAAEDAIAIGGPSFGPTEIGAGFPEDPAAVRLLWAPIDGDAAGSGDLAYTIGHATTEVPQADGSVARSYSKYITVWRRQPNGEWKYETDGGNSRPAA